MIKTFHSYIYNKENKELFFKKKIEPDVPHIMYMIVNRHKLTIYSYLNITLIKKK